MHILGHRQASAEEIDVARHFECDFCKSRVKPKVPLPAQPNRVHLFNHQIGIDVNNLRGRLPNQKIKALNIVVLPKLLTDHWIAWTGVPTEIILDPAQINLGENLVGPCHVNWKGLRFAQ